MSVDVPLYEVADLLFGDRPQSSPLTWGTVQSVDGSDVYVKLNASVATKCSTIASVKAGDRVLVAVVNQAATVLGAKL